MHTAARGTTGPPRGSQGLAKAGAEATHARPRWRPLASATWQDTSGRQTCARPRPSVCGSSFRRDTWRCPGWPLRSLAGQRAGAWDRAARAGDVARKDWLAGGRFPGGFSFFSAFLRPASRFGFGSGAWSLVPRRFSAPPPEAPSPARYSGVGRQVVPLDQRGRSSTRYVEFTVDR
jgi:hypothetical protein